MKKKWLFVLPTDSIQGSEHIVKNFASYVLENKGSCSVIILTKKRSEGWLEYESNMNIIYFPFSNYYLGICFLLPYLFLKKNSEISYTFTSQTIINGTLGLAKKIGLLKNAKIILRESNSIFNLLSGFKLKIYSTFYKIGYSSSSLVICQTDYMKEQLSISLPSLSKKLNLCVIPNPFNYKNISKKNEDIIPEVKEKKFLVAAGRLAHVKGFDLLINVFNEIQEHSNNLHLVILGEGNDRLNLSNQIKKLNLESKVHLPGYVQNVYTYFKNAEVCILSSRIEGFPNVLLQMMSQNSKIVSTLSAGGIENIPNIFTCPPDNSQELKESIIKALESERNNNEIVFKTFLKERDPKSFYNKLFSNLTATNND